MRRAKVDASYVVALPAGSDLAAFEKLARSKSPRIEVTRGAVNDVFGVEGLAFLTRDFARADVDALTSSAGVVLLSASGTDGLKLAREVAGVARDVADAAHGWVLDPETFQVFPAAAFHAHVPGDVPDVRQLIVIRTIPNENEQPALDTAGLRRYGLPDLYFPEAGSRQINQIGELLNGAAQSLLNGGDVNDRGELAIDFGKLGWDVGISKAGTGKAVWRTRWATESDHEGEMVIELVPPNGAGAAGAASLISDCFGSEPDEVTMHDDDDPELLAAAARARADLATLRARFAKGIPNGEHLSIKAKFTDLEDHVEWMWVDVVAFTRDQLKGTLANDPQLIKSLRDGQKVAVKLDDVGDYLHEKPDGARAGGYSIEVFKKRGLGPRP